MYTLQTQKYTHIVLKSKNRRYYNTPNTLLKSFINLSKFYL